MTVKDNKLWTPKSQNRRVKILVKKVIETLKETPNLTLTLTNKSDTIFLFFTEFNILVAQPC